MDGYNSVDNFAPGSTTPTATLTGLDNPIALAFDGNGKLYVANEGNNTVSEFNPGSTTPNATLNVTTGRPRDRRWQRPSSWGAARTDPRLLRPATTRQPTPARQPDHDRQRGPGRVVAHTHKEDAHSHELLD